MAVEYSGLESVEDSGVPEIKLDATLRDSERLVKRCATPPSEATEEYTVAASDAEMRVFEYLVNTEGYLTGSGVGGVSESFVDFEKVEEIVRYALSGVSGGSNPRKLRSIPMSRG
jgi:hypothetical protein